MRLRARITKSVPPDGSESESDSEFSTVTEEVDGVAEGGWLSEARIGLETLCGA